MKLAAKWTKYLWDIRLVGVLMISLFACTLASSSKLLETRSAEFDFTDAVLVYEDVSSSSAATGACRSTWLDQLYGTNSSIDVIRTEFATAIAGQNWETWPDDVSERWHFDTPAGLYTVLFDEVMTVSDLAIDSVPSDVIAELSTYATVYWISSGFMARQQADDCFEYHYHRYP